MSTAEAPKPGKRGSGTFAIVARFAAVCPPVTELMYLGLRALSEIAVQRFPSLQYRELVWFGLLYGIALSYFVLVLPAALAGYVIAKLQAAYGRVRWWAALAIGIVAGVGVQLALTAGVRPSEGSAIYLPGEDLIPMTAFAIAIMAGWAMVRNLYFAPLSAGADR